MKIESKLNELNITLPLSSPPKAMYIPVQRVGNILFVSGQIPVLDGIMHCPGRVGESVSLEEAQDAARICAINLLAAVKHELGDLDEVKKIVKLQGFVNSTDRFNQQHLVINAASQLLYDIFGESGRHTRTAVGVNSLPMDSPVEIEAIFEIKARGDQV